MSKWVSDIKAKLNNHRNAHRQEEQCRKKRSIYKLPPLISDLNRKAYQPRVVSFGPYHHGKPHMKPMEDHKQRALLNFLSRLLVSLDTIFNSMVGVAQELKNSCGLLKQWQDNTERFVHLMIVDGCFMLEILRVAATEFFSDYSAHDPIFGYHGMLYAMPFISRDMLLLENQLPMLVLFKLKGIKENDMI